MTNEDRAYYIRKIELLRAQRDVARLEAEEAKAKLDEFTTTAYRRVNALRDEKLDLERAVRELLDGDKLAESYGMGKGLRLMKLVEKLEALFD